MSLFKRKTHLTVVAENAPVVTDLVWLKRYFDNGWDWSSDHLVCKYFNGAWTGAEDKRPDHFVAQFYEAKPLVERVLKYQRIDVTECCSAIALAMLTSNFDCLSIQRATAIGVVFGAHPADRELMISFLQHRTSERILCFASAAMLAELRTGQPGLRHDELLLWKERLFHHSNDVRKQRTMLAYVERALGND